MILMYGNRDDEVCICMRFICKNRIFESYKIGKRLEIDFLFFSVVFLVVFMERKIVLVVLY